MPSLAGEVDEALAITENSGDPSGTAWNAPRPPGTSEERCDAVLDGYSGGLTACYFDVSNGPPAWASRRSKQEPSCQGDYFDALRSFPQTV